MAETSGISLGQALAAFGEAQGTRGAPGVQADVNRFVRWCGRDRAATSLTPVDIEEFCASLEGAGEGSTRRIASVREFLGYLHRQEWTRQNLSSHARPRRTGRKVASDRSSIPAASPMQLTSEGYRQLREELAARLEERLTVAEEIRRAAADKDFTENSPLDAAREHQGHLEARIRELEATVQGAVVLDGRSRPGGASVKVGVGSRVVLRQQDTGREVSYLLVEPREADPANGKLSIASPVGRALLNRNVGQEVEVATPRGPVRYLIARLGG